MNDPKTVCTPTGYEVDFVGIFSILWRRRKLIGWGTLIGTILAIVISLLLPRVYRSEGFYQMKLPVPLYKNSSTQFFNPNRFQLFAGQEKSFNEKDRRNIKMNFPTATDISKWISPVYAFAKGDMRELAQLSKDEANSVIGLNLRYEADSPDKAYAYVRFFGNYIRDCLIYVTMYNYVMDRYSGALSGLNRNENDLIANHFQLQQNMEKMKDMRAVLSKYPESAKIENRQLVSVQEGGYRFLPPVAQIVGIESTLADLRRHRAQLDREREKLTIGEEYFSRCNGVLKKIGERGELILLQLKAVKSDLFKNKDLKKDTVKEVFNELNIDFQAFDLTFFTNYRFISGPTVPVRHIKPRRSVIVIASCFVSFFLLMMLAFVLHWWQRNGKSIVS